MADTKTYAASTLKEIKFKLARYREDLGHLMMGQLYAPTVAEYLDSFEQNSIKVSPGKTQNHGMPV